jgi:hypothetical protein
VPWEAHRKQLRNERVAFTAPFSLGSSHAGRASISTTSVLWVAARAGVLVICLPGAFSIPRACLACLPALLSITSTAVVLTTRLTEARRAVVVFIAICKVIVIGRRPAMTAVATEMPRGVASRRGTLVMLAVATVLSEFCSSGRCVPL